MNAIPPLDYRSINWVAEVLDLEPREIVQLLEEGVLPGVRLGRKWLVSEYALRQFMHEEAQQQASRREPVETRRTTSAAPVSRTTRSRCILRGKIIEASSMTALAAKVLEALSLEDPSFLERFSQEGGRERRYIARSQSELYPHRPDLASRFSREIEPGWWLGTNYSRRELETLLSRACQIAGLAYGQDLVMMPHHRTIDRAKAMAFVGIVADPDPEASSHLDQYFAGAAMNEQG